MPSILCVDPEVRTKTVGGGVERDVLELIEERAVISLDGLAVFLPQYTWNQIFHAVDRLARDRRIILRRHRFDYSVFTAHYAD